MAWQAKLTGCSLRMIMREFVHTLPVFQMFQSIIANNVAKKSAPASRTAIVVHRKLHTKDAIKHVKTSAAKRALISPGAITCGVFSTFRDLERLLLMEVPVCEPNWSTKILPR